MRSGITDENRIGQPFMSICLYILSFIAVLALIVGTTDAFHALNEWKQRIHIGRWNNRKVWQEAVEKKARQWLAKSPTVQKTDQDRRILWDMWKGNYASHTIQSWQDGGLILGLSKEDAQLYLKHHPNLFHRTLEVDQAFLAFALKQQSALTEEQEAKIQELLSPYISKNQTIPYRQTVQHLRFVDTIGLVCPFLYQTGAGQIANKQIEEYEEALYKGIFPAHAFNLSNRLPLGVFDWCRGIGWYVLGLILAQKGIQCQQERILRLANALFPLQRPQGGFSCMVFNPQERYESSGTAIIGLLFLEAYKLSQETRYLKAAFQIDKSLMQATRRNGAIDYAQGDTRGVGFYSQKFSIMPFAQGMALLLSKRLNDYEAVLG